MRGWTLVCDDDRQPSGWYIEEKRCEGVGIVGLNYNYFLMQEARRVRQVNAGHG